MHISDKLVNERRVWVNIKQEEFYKLLVDYVAHAIGMEMDSSVDSKIQIFYEDHSDYGFKHRVEVTLIKNLAPKDVPENGKER